MKQIPNIFTLLNLVLGCIAIVVTLQSGIVVMSTTDGTQILSMPQHIFLASLCIALASIVDFLDGFVARLFGVVSDMGKQLDSLSDLVSFGVAPGIIIYQFLRLSVASGADGLEASTLWLLPAFILPCAGAWRLARFNLDVTQSYHFRGMPIPAVGLLVASFPLIFWHADTNIVESVFLNKWFWYGFIAVVSFLMVSTIPMMALKFKDYSIKNNLTKWLLVAISIVLVILFKWTAIPIIFIAYILLSLPLKNSTAS